MDKPLHLLIDAIAAARGDSLWLADEHVDAAALALLPPRADLHALSNRSDVVAHFRARGLAAVLNDFELPQCNPAHIFFRVAKEKALVHHAINASLDALAAGATLWLAGDKHDGIKTYIDKAAARAGGDVVVERDGTALLGAVSRGGALGPALPDNDYRQLRTVDFDAHFSAWSKPGIFGWEKIDAGSAFLIEHLPQAFPQAPANVLDLGCGYGYLTLQAAAMWPAADFLAVDNNIAAVNACAANIAGKNIRGEARCTDCGKDIETKFAAILCNPPFHQGFDIESGLTEKFLRDTRRLLAPGGRALFVVNQFIALERKAAPLFAAVTTLARNKSFKLVLLEN